MKRPAENTKTFHAVSILDNFLQKKTIVAEPLDENTNEETKSNILSRRKEILTKVKQKIDEVVN